MSDPSQSAARRLRRIEEAILEVDGVVGVRVWELPGRVEVGVEIAPSDCPPDVLQRVSERADALREEGEVWDVGVLTDGVGG